MKVATFLCSFALSALLSNTLFAAEESKLEDDNLETSKEYQVTYGVELCDQLFDERYYTTGLAKQFDRLLPGDDGYIFRMSADLRSDFQVNDSYRHLQHLVRALHQQGTQLLLLYVPTKGLINGNQAQHLEFDEVQAKQQYLQKVAMFREMGIIVPDMQQFLEAQYGNDDFFYRKDFHWTHQGAEITAELVANTLTEKGMAAKLAPAEFEVLRNGSYDLNSTMVKVAELICKQRIYPETRDSYTYRKIQDDTELFSDDDSLFGESAGADVVLIGTSFSAIPAINFHGYLQKALATEIDSYAYGGAGDTGSWLTYLHSGELFRNPPKLIIWEISAYYSLNDRSFEEKTITPLLSQGCHEQVIVHQGNYQFSQQQNLPSIFLDQQPTASEQGRYIVEMEFDQSNIFQLGFNLWYDNARLMKKEVKINTRSGLGGQFTFQLDHLLQNSTHQLIGFELERIEQQAVADYTSAETQENALTMNYKICYRDATS